MNKFFKHIPAGIFSALVVCAILFLTLVPQPLPEAEDISFFGFDKVGHFFMFGGLCFAVTFDLCLAACRSGKQVKSGSSLRIWAVAGGSIVFGGVIELLQMWMALGRTAEWADFVADMLGALLFAYVSPFIVPYIIRCKKGSGY